MTVAAIAARNVFALEKAGAVFTLDDDGYWHCDLNGCPLVTSEAQAAVVADILFEMRDEIRAVLIGQRTIH
jgi:hypothetical protein